ncbi:MAG: hypothetical protein KAX38_00435, partial [Candidatus Krumholzibacteria bacterium]|nr:hypothetical protein [Candidatus Krumholzibacteria bacterium]
MSAEKRCLLFIFCLILALSVCGNSESGTVPEEEELPEIPLKINLIKNPSFEDWNGNVPANWELRRFKGDGKIMNMYGKSSDEKNSGQFSFYLRGLFNVDRWMVLVQRLPITPGYRLNFSAAIRSQNVKRNRDQEDRANIYIRFLDGDGKRLEDRHYADAYTRHRVGTSPWARSRKNRVDIPDKARFVEIGLINLMTGHLYFDDVELELIKPIPWKKKNTKYVEFYHLEGYPFPEGAIEKEKEMLEGFVKRFGIKLSEKIKYYYYPSEELFMEITGLKRYRQKALWKKKEIHTMTPTEDSETVHMLLVDYGFPPLGLTKGIVYNMRGSLEGKKIHITAKGFLVEKKIPALYKIIKAGDLKRVGTE